MLVMLPSLAGCAIGPAHRTPQLDLAPSFREAAGTVNEPAAPPGAFWAALGDATLERLVAQAASANPDVRIAEARVRGARAARLDATLDLLPTVTAVGGYTRQRLPSVYFPGTTGTLPAQSIWDVGVELQWEIDLYGRLRRGLQSQGALVASAEEDLRDVQVLLAAELARAYFELRGAEERLTTARQNADNQQRTLALTEERLNAGRGSAFDSERARAQLNLTLAVIPPLEAAVAAAGYRIAVLLGRTPESVVPELGQVVAGPVLPDSLSVPSPDSVVRQRPDVRSAERQLAARTARVGVATADYLPRLSVGGTAGLSSSTAGSLGDDGTRRYAVGPVISWPALNLGRVKAGVDAARAVESEARARYELTVLRALEEVETALVNYRKAQERLARLEDAAAASERAAELARTRFREGVSDFLQVLDAERTLLEAQDRRAQGRTDAHTSLVGVYRALGGNWPTGE
ncbi:MAG TPA: TolC family protein [Gemmatimonadales bacterium]|nr:TolC family protein [Gemmatimonadales bacterium]